MNFFLEPRTLDKNYLPAISASLFLPPLTLLIMCGSLYLFRRYFGPKGLFFTSSIFLSLVLVLAIVALIYQLNEGCYFFIDMGRWFFLYDFIDSNLLFISDPLALLTTILVVLLTILAQLFGVEYMYREAFIIRLIYLLNMFATSVVFLFYVYDFFLVLVVWECIGLFSLFLVNFYSNRLYTIKAALKTFIFSRVSDFFICIVFFLFVLVFNSTDFTIIFIKIPFSAFVTLYIGSFGFDFLTVVAILMALSASVKAAQFGFHVWLPDAMEAPTPASALIHSSTLVIMGIYLITRFSILFEFSNTASLFVAVLGSLTIAVGAISATFQNDIKKLVAYSTVSQMGYLFCGCGFLSFNEVIFYLFVHAVNKAFLFILVGYIVHFFYGNTDMRFMGGSVLFSYELIFFSLIVSLNLTGLPLTGGFIAKESLLFHTLKTNLGFDIVRSMWFVSFFFTPIYMLLLNFYVFWYTSKNQWSSYSDNFKLQLFRSKLESLNYLLRRPFVLSKITTLTLCLFLFITSLTGNYFLLLLFELIGSQDLLTSSAWHTTNTWIFNSNNNLNINSLDIINFIIVISVLNLVRFLLNLKLYL